ncbi:ABC transporter family substrate-binding protein [Streptomyces sp. NBC_00257]|uniref:ABC transporter family substrate-binding protein n=1 Tax=unclassified Streptomyces TaxID=2593676 RepID=UPI0022510493|nr:MULTISPECIES: ABC transporter family substrate-binding protein [unclassified Streptomyces]MCX4864730.1 ABC transporter family substrate-binding protein [Streptomyces sp. NBC_00906]MCX4895968.1 ABC transporter family substrate-binding protein [Streptomyces sp. NBC_00892]MCX5429258.1 ABC transporter family substrate-binding protein [Streptomyces sp. NBC_00062]
MSHVGVPRGTARKRRSLALLTTGVLTLPVLAGCSSDDGATGAAAPQDVAVAGRSMVAEGGTVNWAIDAMPTTLNAFQADADATTTRITGALLPTLFPLDAKGRPQLNPDYLESAKVVESEPRQVVVYRLNQQAVWSDGREIGAPDFVAQWRALSGKDSAFWTARNAGYERIEKIERGADDFEVRVTFAKPYADWRSLFSPLYPKDVTGSPDAFNDGARTTLKATSGPFRLRGVDKATGEVTLVRNPRWWGSPAKLDSLVFRAVATEDRTGALAAGRVDVADVDAASAHRIAQAAGGRGADGQPLAQGPGAGEGPAAALRAWAVAHGSNAKEAAAARAAGKKTRAAADAYAAEQAGLRAYVVRKSLEPAYTQLALNGESGPLADDRVRRAVARALDRQELVDTVLEPLGLPARPLGSHLALAGQPAYKDSSDALGGQDTEVAQALLADAGWTPEGAIKKSDGTKAGSEAGKKDAEKEAGKAAQKDAEKKEAEKKGTGPAAGKAGSTDGKSGDGDPVGGATHVLAPAPAAAFHSSALLRQAGYLSESGVSEDIPSRVTAQDKRSGGAAGAYAPAGTAAPAQAADGRRGPLGKDGKPLTLRFVLPSGPGSEPLRSVGDKISAMLESVGIRTEITKVSDESYFQDHIASGDYDLALYSWPATAYPATDDRPIFAKPVPATDGSLLVEQNYTRVGTDHIDQLFDQAVSELDEDAARDLMKQADARIWAAAGSIPLYQRPQLVAANRKLANVGAFGFGTPHYQDIGFKKPQAAGAPANKKK